MRIGIDIDGVLANFWEAYERLFIEVGGDLFGDRKWPAQEPQVWDWPYEFGYTKTQTKLVWKKIEENPYFWMELNPLAEFEPFREWITDNDKDEIYFITDRPGQYTKLQTECWFGAREIPYATVLVSSQKGLCAQALNLELYIDDKTENIMAVQIDSPTTKAYLLNRPYNLAARNIKLRTDSLMEVLKGAT